MFYGFGEYSEGAWLFYAGKTRFVLAESCSGTTFFSLLVAYIAFRIKTHGIALLWLVYAYPITLLANAFRVISSIPAHNLLAHYQFDAISNEIHVVAGVSAFLLCYLPVAYLIERSTKDLQHVIPAKS